MLADSYIYVRYRRNISMLKQETVRGGPYTDFLCSSGAIRGSDACLLLVVVYSRIGAT